MVGTHEYISLNRTEDVWVGHFTGLGSVSVWPDGHWEVHVDGDEEIAESSLQQEMYRALEYGWAEPLSLVRRGFVLVHGCAVVDPTMQRALVIGGDLHEQGVLAVELVARGWSMMADRVVPLTIDGASLIVHPRRAPILVTKGRAERAGRTGVPVRQGSDAVAVDAPHVSEPALLGAVAYVLVRQSGDEALHVAWGRKRFDVARKLLAGGALAPVDVTAEITLTQTVRLASVPCAQVRLDPRDLDGALDAVCTWWGSV